MWLPTSTYSFKSRKKPNELYHHGILGMQWGHRNGPPYPLGAEAHSESEKKAGWRKSLDSQGYNTARYKRKADKVDLEKQGGLVDVAIIGGLTVLPYVALAAIGAVSKVVDNARFKKEHAEDFAFRKQCDEDRAKAEVDPKTGIKVKADQNMSREEDTKRTNPDYKIDRTGAARMNCVNCTMAYEMRRRGFEVEAEKRLEGRRGADVAKNVFGASSKKVMYPPDPNKNLDGFWDYMLRYEGLARYGRNKELADKTYKALKQEPKGSRGQILITWNRYGGHSMAYEITKKGEVNIINSQVNQIMTTPQEVKEYLAYGVATQYQRLDDKKLNVDQLKKGDYVK